MWKTNVLQSRNMNSFKSSSGLLTPIRKSTAISSMMREYSSRSWRILMAFPGDLLMIMLKVDYQWTSPETAWRLGLTSRRRKHLRVSIESHPASCPLWLDYTQNPLQGDRSCVRETEERMRQIYFAATILSASDKSPSFLSKMHSRSFHITSKTLP